MSFSNANWSLLESIDSPADVRKLNTSQLKVLAKQLREFMLDSVASTGGHLSAGLGTVELTVALHYVFNTPYDRLVWDVGHQTYPHKILTGRRDKMTSLRKKGGIAGKAVPPFSLEPLIAGRQSSAVVCRCFYP